MKTNKKIIRILETISLFVVCLFMFSFYDNPSARLVSGSSLSYNDYETHYVPFSDLYSGQVTASQSDTYVIETSEDLYQFSLVSSGDDKATYLSLNYVLGADIDYSESSRYGRFFRPIGFLPNPSPTSGLTALENEAINPYAFQGTFDGQGFEISNLILERITITNYTDNYDDSLEHYSMFSVVGSSGTVKNLGLLNPSLIQPINVGIMSTSSFIAGHNHGNIHHVYVIDDRDTNDSGLFVNGDFFLAGMVVRNYGTFTDSFLSTKHVLGSSVLDNLGTSVLVKENTGTIDRVYYDSTVYLDTVTSTFGTGLSTADFQVPTNFSNEWYFNQSYTSSTITLNQIYPTLKGFEEDNGTFILDEARDILFMSKAIDLNVGFESADFKLQSDIDMSQVSRYGYQTPQTPFTGSLTSYTYATYPANTLYTRASGDNAYFTILNLSITKGVDLGAFAGYGLFGVLSGSIDHLNIVKATIRPVDYDDFFSEDYIALGLVASKLNNGSIEDIYVDADSSLDNTTLNKTHYGSLVGIGFGDVNQIIIHGDMVLGTHLYDAKTNDSSIGGLIGFAGLPESHSSTYLMNVDHIESYVNITGFGYTTNNNSSRVFIGGLIGAGYMKYLNFSDTYGSIQSYPEDAYVDEIYLGGMIGYHMYSGKNNTIQNNDFVGHIDLIVNQSLTASVGLGYGIVSNSVDTIRMIYKNLENHGTFDTVVPSGITLSQSDLETMDISVAGIAIDYEADRDVFNSVKNYSDLSIDISLVKNVSGVLITKNQYDSADASELDPLKKFNNRGSLWFSDYPLLYSSYNYGNIDAYTTRDFYFPQIKITGLSLGRNVYLRNDSNLGDITVNISHHSTTALTSAPASDKIDNQEKNIIIAGIAEFNYTSRRASDLYNNGHISFTNDPTKTVNYHVYASGIFNTIYNTTTNATTNNNVRNLINDGYVTIDGNVNGNTYASGIVNHLQGFIHSAINSGDIFNTNEPGASSGLDHLVSAAGIANGFTRNSTSTRITNGLNYGDVVAYAKGNEGIAYSGGISASNNRSIDYDDISSNSADRYYLGSISNSINYGSIYAYNDRTETSSDDDLPYSASGGILGVGLLKVQNSINYGNVYSNTLAGGIIGVNDLYAFSRYRNPTSVYIANLINYGDVLKLTNANAFSFNETNGIVHNNSHVSNAITASGHSGFGGIIGFIHVGSNTWDFDSGNYQLNRSRYQYWLNFNESTDIIGVLPSDTITNAGFASSLASKVYTVKLDDETMYPFTDIKSYSLDDAAINASGGYGGTTYMGIFNTSFPFMSPPSTSPEISNNIGFIPTNRVNPNLISRIGLTFDFEDETKGIFAVGPTSGIGEEGLYQPDNWSLSGIYQAKGNWEKQVYSGNQTFNQKLNEMKQLSLSLAVNIEELELVDDLQNPTLFLNDPIIDLENKRITYYLADNTPEGTVVGETGSPVQAYVKAGPGLESQGAYESGGVWYGTHIFNGSQFVLDAQGTHVIVNTTIFSGGTATEFYANIDDSSTYELGYRARFYYEDNNPSASLNLPSTITSAYGSYGADETIYDASGNPIATYADHMGTVRVYSEAYDDQVQHPQTYADYEIVIVRLQSQSFTSIEDLTVNGDPATPVSGSTVTNIDVSN